MNNTHSRLAGVVIISAAIFTSCTSTSVLGLSRASYVDEEIRKMNDTDADVQRINDELEELRGLSSTVEGLNLEIEGLEKDLAAAQEADKEILLMAEEFRNRLDTLPRETLLELRTAIDDYLADSADDSPPADG